MRGYFFTVFGIMALIMPSITVATVVIACGAYGVVDAIFAHLSKNTGREHELRPIARQLSK